jgi:hypothetical protein
MNFSRSILILLIFSSLASFKRYQQVDEWMYEREKKGIKVFTKKSKWGHLRDSRAQMFVSTTPENILKFLTDFDNYKTWFPRCSQSKLIARLNENESIVHLFFDAPWPIKNRDCVMRVKVEKDARTGVITITETSEPKYLKPEDGVVRISQLISIWKFTPKNGGTEVYNEYSSNPGGNIPDWMTNTQSVENPLATFESIQQKVVTKK